MIIHNATLTGSISMQAPPVISGSLTLTGSINATGDITASSARFSNIITAQTLVVQVVSSSIEYASGSNIFGNLASNTQVFTGSVNITGSTHSIFGNVGILTTSSLFPLHIISPYNKTTGSIGQIAQMFISTNESSPAAPFGLRFQVFGASSLANRYTTLQTTDYSSADGGNIVMQLGGGNVGIGTTTISSSANGGSNFIVGGSGPAITIKDDSSGGHWSLLARTGGSTPLFRIWDVVNSTDRLVINSSGSIGIGTPSPSTLVHINTTRSSGTDVNVITLSDNVTGVQTSGFGVRIVATSNSGAAKSAIAFEADGGTNNDTAIAFYTQNSAAFLERRMNITRLGNVGINNTLASSNYKLGVSGSAYVNGTNNKGVFITDGASYASIVGLNSAISAYNSLELRASGVDGQLILTSGGNVGFFTTNPVGSVSTSLVHINGASAVLRVGPNYFVANGSIDRDFIELQADGANTKLVSPNETFSIINTGGGAGSWEIDVISGTGGVKLTNGATSWSAISSDRRKKKNFEPSQGLAEVLQIEPVKYHFEWDDDSIPKRMGFIAQNIQPLIPEMVSTTREKAPDGSDYLTITPDYILPVLVKAIQELKAQIDELKNK